MRGSLPWQGLKADTVKERYRKIGEVKQSTKVKDLCGEYPAEFGRFLSYARGLEFSETPNYRQQIAMFEALIKARGWALDWEFDWMRKREGAAEAKPGSVSTAKAGSKPAESRRRSSSVNRAQANNSKAAKTPPTHLNGHQIKSSTQNNLNRI